MCTQTVTPSGVSCLIVSNVYLTLRSIFKKSSNVEFVGILHGRYVINIVGLKARFENGKKKWIIELSDDEALLLVKPYILVFRIQIHNLLFRLLIYGWVDWVHLNKS